MKDAYYQKLTKEIYRLNKHKNNYVPVTLMNARIESAITALKDARNWYRQYKKQLKKGQLNA